MNEEHIIVYGSIPSKKNSRNIFVRGGKIMNIPQANYKKWHEESIPQLVGIQKKENIQEVVLTFFPKDKRLFDLSNKAESIMDLLVDGGIIEDDNYSIIPVLTLIIGEQDKEEPRCEIIIKHN
jgi:Holliday junction resolvase RusA-like endonuclease